MGTFTADRDGWYQVNPDGLEYIGPDKPDDLTNAAKVETSGGERRVYQNSGANLAIGDWDVIPNATWTVI